MRTLNRALVAFVLVGAVAAGATQLDQDRAKVLMHDLWQLPANMLTIDAEQHRHEDLVIHRDVTQNIMHDKHQIGLGLMAGKVTLKEAVGRFMVVAQRANYPWDHLEEKNACWSLERRCGYYVVEEIRSTLTAHDKDPALWVAPYLAELESWQ